jgi:hypothetical protein
MKKIAQYDQLTDWPFFYQGLQALQAFRSGASRNRKASGTKTCIFAKMRVC